MGSPRLPTSADLRKFKSSATRRIQQISFWARERPLRNALQLTERASTGLPIFRFHGDFQSHPTGRLVRKAFDQALENVGGPAQFVRDIEGMSGQKYRTFINNLVKSHPDPRYLEVGSWRGSTAAAALDGNTAKALCIDNWSQFGGPKAEFLANIARARAPSTDFDLIESDFRAVDYRAIGRFNIFLFDGPHEETDQYDGVNLARPALERSFILIVDDWNWQQVRIGTFRALRDAGHEVLSAIEVLTTANNQHPRISGRESDWHNGYFIAVLESR